MRKYKKVPCPRCRRALTQSDEPLDTAAECESCSVRYPHANPKRNLPPSPSTTPAHKNWVAKMVAAGKVLDEKHLAMKKAALFWSRGKCDEMDALNATAKYGQAIESYNKLLKAQPKEKPCRLFRLKKPPSSNASSKKSKAASR